MAPNRIACEIDEHAQPRRFRRLHAQRAEVEPARAAVDGLSETRQKHESEQRDADQKQRSAEAMPDLARNGHGEREAERAGAERAEMPSQEVQRLADSSIRDRDRR